MIYKNTGREEHKAEEHGEGILEAPTPNREKTEREQRQHRNQG